MIHCEAGKKGENTTTPATSIDLSGYSDYQVLSADNLLIYPIEVSGPVYHEGSTDYYVNGSGVSHSEFYKDYNPTTGILTIRPAVGSYKETEQSGDKNLNAICGYYKVKIYLIK